MKKKGYRGSKCEKRYLSKCADGVVRTYNVLESKYADILQADENVKEFRCNVLMDGFPEGNYCSDFVVTTVDGEIQVRECVFRKDLNRPRVIRMLDESLDYWRKRGITDWKLVIDKKKENSNGQKNTH